MGQDLLRARANLKASWLAANRRALVLQQRANQATKEAGVLQKALDAIENAAGDMSMEADPPRRRNGRQSETVLKLVAELQAHGPMGAPELAKATGIPYWTVNHALRRGPFQQGEVAHAGKSRSQKWTVDETKVRATDEAPAK